MNWEAFGAIGEWVGAVGVVVTLACLVHVWDRCRVGAADPAEWERVGPRLARILQTPFGRVWWAEGGGGFTPEFRTELERLSGLAAVPLPAE